RAHYGGHLGAAGLTRGSVADVDPAGALATVERLFEQARAPAADAPPVEPEPQPAAPQKVWKYLTKQQAHLVVGFLGTTVSDPDRYPMEVLSTILSGQGGRLF